MGFNDNKKPEAKKNLIIGLIGLVVILGLAFLATKIFRKRGIPHAAPVVSITHPYLREHKCPGPTETHAMADQYLQGILEKGSKFEVKVDWYWCKNEIKNGDLVLFKYNLEKEPVVRRVVAHAGDKFKVKETKGATKAWNLIVNNEMVKDFEGNPYYFGGAAKPLLSLAEEQAKTQTNGELIDQQIIIVSSVSPGYFDSGTMSVVSLLDIVGKVELLK